MKPQVRIESGWQCQRVRLRHESAPKQRRFRRVNRLPACGCVHLSVQLAPAQIPTANATPRVTRLGNRGIGAATPPSQLSKRNLIYLAASERRHILIVLTVASYEMRLVHSAHLRRSGLAIGRFGDGGEVHPVDCLIELRMPALLLHVVRPLCQACRPGLRRLCLCTNVPPLVTGPTNSPRVPHRRIQSSRHATKGAIPTTQARVYLLLTTQPMSSTLCARTHLCGGQCAGTQGPGLRQGPSWACPTRVALWPWSVARLRRLGALRTATSTAAACL